MNSPFGVEAAAAASPGSPTRPSAPRWLIGLIGSDLRAKAEWLYHRQDLRAVSKALLTDGTPAMVCYRLMQWSNRLRLWPLAMLFNKANTVFCNCVIGRDADFGPRFVLIHATGVVINTGVRGGTGVKIEHQVTIGAEKRQAPVLGDEVFVGAGARLIGGICVGDRARVGANAVVVADVPADSTVAGIPAKVVRQRAGPTTTSTTTSTNTNNRF